MEEYREVARDIRSWFKSSLVEIERAKDRDFIKTLDLMLELEDDVETQEDLLYCFFRENYSTDIMDEWMEYYENKFEDRVFAVLAAKEKDRNLLSELS